MNVQFALISLIFWISLIWRSIELTVEKLWKNRWKLIYRNTSKLICLDMIISFNLSNHWCHLCKHSRFLFYSIRLQSFHSTRLTMNILFYVILWPASILLVCFWMYHSTWLAYSTCLTVLVVFYLINHDRSTLLRTIIMLFRQSSCHNYKIIISI